MAYIRFGYTREGVSCYYVGDNCVGLVDGYLEDTANNVFYKSSQDRRWLELFLKTIKNRIPFDISSFTLKSLYDLLGVTLEYKDGTPYILWWPVWVDANVKLDDFNVCLSVRSYDSLIKQPLINRVFCRVRMCKYHTDILARCLYCELKGISEDKILGKHIDHLCRVPSCNLIESLKDVYRGDNLAHVQKRYSDSSSIYKGVTITKGKINFSVYSQDKPHKNVKIVVNSEEIAAKLYDWFYYYVINPPMYLWQIEELSKESIFSLLEDFSDRNYTYFLRLLYNSGSLGKILAYWIQSYLNRKIIYSNVIYRKNVRLHLTRTGTFGVIQLYLLGLSAKEYARINEYIYREVFKETTLVPVFCQRISTEEEFRSILTKNEVNLPRYKHWLTCLNEEYNPLKGKLTEYIKTL